MERELKAASKRQNAAINRSMSAVAGTNLTYVSVFWTGQKNHLQPVQARTLIQVVSSPIF